jgi:hypothetical protein
MKGLIVHFRETNLRGFAVSVRPIFREMVHSEIVSHSYAPSNFQSTFSDGSDSGFAATKVFAHVRL